MTRITRGLGGRLRTPGDAPALLGSGPTLQSCTLTDGAHHPALYRTSESELHSTSGFPPVLRSAAPNDAPRSGTATAVMSSRSAVQDLELLPIRVQSVATAARALGRDPELREALQRRLSGRPGDFRLPRCAGNRHDDPPPEHIVDAERAPRRPTERLDPFPVPLEEGNQCCGGVRSLVRDRFHTIEVEPQPSFPRALGVDTPERILVIRTAVVWILTSIEGPPRQHPLYNQHDADE